MSRAFAATQYIDRPAAQVWRVLTDWTRAADWMPGVDDARGEAGTTITFVARGKERTSEITAIREGESITLTSVQGPVRADYTYTLTPGTTVTLEADVTVRGALKILAPVLRAVIRRTDGRQLDALKRVVEN